MFSINQDPKILYNKEIKTINVCDDSLPIFNFGIMSENDKIKFLSMIEIMYNDKFKEGSYGQFGYTALTEYFIYKLTKSKFVVIQASPMQEKDIYYDIFLKDNLSWDTEKYNDFSIFLYERYGNEIKETKENLMKNIDPECFKIIDN